jgi:hypothetical protein
MQGQDYLGVEHKTWISPRWIDKTYKDEQNQPSQQLPTNIYT